jgi:hypothetical protein
LFRVRAAYQGTEVNEINAGEAPMPAMLSAVPVARQRTRDELRGRCRRWSGSTTDEEMAALLYTFGSLAVTSEYARALHVSTTQHTHFISLHLSK